jgi:hypothetical protein
MKDKQDFNDKKESFPGFKELEQLREADFDGHTAFQIMTFEQKLAWLSEAVVSTYLLAKDNPQASCNSFFNK